MHSFVDSSIHIPPVCIHLFVHSFIYISQRYTFFDSLIYPQLTVTDYTFIPLIHVYTTCMHSFVLSSILYHLYAFIHPLIQLYTTCMHSFVHFFIHIPQRYTFIDSLIYPKLTITDYTIQLIHLFIQIPLVCIHSSTHPFIYHSGTLVCIHSSTHISQTNKSLTSPFIYSSINIQPICIHLLT